MKAILKFVCLIAVISAAHCAQYCSNKNTTKKGECLSREICNQNILIPDAECEAGRMCCILKFFDSNCGDGKPSILMLYSRYNETNSRLFCSGTLINSEFILTAAHCIDPKSTLPLFAKIHDSDVEFKILSHYSFPGFANNNTHRLNDVGLFQLEQPIDPSINAKTVCLGDQNLDLTDESLTIYGYDRDSKSVKETKTSFYSYDSCLEYLNKNNFDHNISPQDSLCYDDSSDHVPNFVSGAPLIVIKDNKYYQYGITTFGIMDRVKGETTLAVSPKLSIYQGWITSTVYAIDPRINL